MSDDMEGIDDRVAQLEVSGKPEIWAVFPNTVCLGTSMCSLLFPGGRIEGCFTWVYPLSLVCGRYKELGTRIDIALGPCWFPYIRLGLIRLCLGIVGSSNRCEEFFPRILCPRMTHDVGVQREKQLGRGEPLDET